MDNHLIFNDNLFESIDNEETAYWLGFLDADGCVHNGSNYDYKIELSLKEEDINHLIKFKQFVGKDNKIAKRIKTKAVRYSFRNKKVWQDLINLGCIPNKSLILQFPTQEQVSDEFLHPFLRGYFDGDGSFWYENKFGMNLLSSKDFLNGLKERYTLFKDLTIYPIHYDRPDKGQRIQTANKQIVLQFLSDIYSNANIYLDRKYQKYQDFLATL